jgi:hypothetical protein
MPRKSNGKAVQQPAWFRVGAEESEEGRWVRARDEREAVRRWCQDPNQQDFWQYNNTAVVETIYGGHQDHIPSRPCGLPKKWHIDASQPPAWIIERMTEEE